MMFNKPSLNSVSAFRRILGDENVLFDKESLSHYSHDETEDLKFLPEIILKPNSAQQVSEILKICNRELIPVTPRGAGTRARPPAGRRCR